ncbi:hypothetical protein RAA17_12140 [Komagataeibacter rhaeticus]|nr:hypothetical protein [Komagataeibacter rhaeticus]
MAARVLLIGIWNHADDGGGFEWKPLTLKMRIFPADAVDVSVLLDELAGADAITRYEHAGRSYGAVRNFGKWQKPKKPSRFCPMPEQVRKYAHTAHIKTDDEAQESSELPKVETEDKDPSVPSQCGTGSEPVPNQFRTSPENRFQKGGREEGRKVIYHPHYVRALAHRRTPTARDRRQANSTSSGKPIPGMSGRTLPGRPTPRRGPRQRRRRSCSVCRGRSLSGLTKNQTERSSSPIRRHG